ncbi:MAG: peptidylprolyl isomerase [Planctomycetota bacterium]
MAQKRHAAATEVTVAPLAEATGFEKFVHSYWKHGVALFVVVACAIVGLRYFDQESKGRVTADWQEFMAMVGFNGLTPQFNVDAAELRAAAADPAKPTAAWALLAAAVELEGKGSHDEALSVLGQLEREHPTHPVVADRVEMDGSLASPVAHLRARIEGMKKLETDHPDLFDNPPPAADAPRVRLSTTKGDIVVALYPEYAPKHVANFLELVEKGTYDGTKFHRVIDGFMIQGGDPNSVSGDPSTWGQGDVGYKIPRETSRLAHFEGYLAAAKMGQDTESSGCQFYITLGAAHHLDGQHTVYGKVVEGMDVVRAIGSAPSSAESAERPADPVTVTKAEKID